jgi:hypothetical protein
MKRPRTFAVLADLGIHRFFAKLHGIDLRRCDDPEESPTLSDDFPSVYAAYAEATAQANALLQRHGPHSPEFAAADVASMRLFHRAKKMQGLKKPRTPKD